MDVALLQEQLRRSEDRNEVLGREVASLRAEFASLRGDYETLVDATRVIISERDALRQRVAELEAVNHRLVDMLWGRRSERRSDSPDQQHLPFGDQAEPPGAEEQQVITAQAEEDEARDRELLRRLLARRKARREKQEQGRREDFPPGIERRERLLDLPEDEKAGLTRIGVKGSERMRF
jgi:hypothetical protein